MVATNATQVQCLCPGSRFQRGVSGILGHHGAGEERRLTAFPDHGPESHPAVLRREVGVELGERQLQQHRLLRVVAPVVRPRRRFGGEVRGGVGGGGFGRGVEYDADALVGRGVRRVGGGEGEEGAAAVGPRHGGAGGGGAAPGPGFI